MEALVPFFSAAFGALVSALLASQKMRQERKQHDAEIDLQRSNIEHELTTQVDKLRAEYATEFAVEGALRALFELGPFRYRSFTLIKHFIDGFDSNELRKHLVRAGAVRFMGSDGTEFWALWKVVAKDFTEGEWKLKNEPKANVPDSEFFPRAFHDETQF